MLLGVDCVVDLSSLGHNVGPGETECMSEQVGAWPSMLWWKCSGCLKTVTILDVHLPSQILVSFVPVEAKGPVVRLGNINAIFCYGSRCFQQILKYNDYEFELTKVNCDYCGLPGASGIKGHRCSRCLIKVYCGEECKDQDWAVHKLVCREGEEERKK